MIVSMTGFGGSARAEDGVSYSLEVRSLNNRYFKVSIKLPEGLQFLEPEVEKMLRARLGRGSITYTLRMRNESPSASCDVNQAALEKYVRTISAANVPDNVHVTIDLAAVSALPGVCQPPEPDEALREQQRKTVRELTDQAVAALVAMRQTEGRVLRDDMLGHCGKLTGHIQAIESRAPSVVGEYHERLHRRVADLLAAAKLELEQDALAREVAVYAERCDISEEIVRLRSHLEQFERLLDADDHAGRKLDFLAQEMLRETNTVGSKSNDAEIARNVIEIKALIDRLKEQVQNVE